MACLSLARLYESLSGYMSTQGWMEGTPVPVDENCLMDFSPKPVKQNWVT